MVNEPHFDDELTVLTAQPVVPLEQIDAKIKHRRRWFLGGAFAVAMLLGAASALVSAYFRLRHLPPEPEIQTSAVSVSEPAAENVVPAVEPAHVVEATTPEAPKLKPASKTDKPKIKNSVLVDQWQEQRPRRVERSERRRAQHHDRDLSNIDEIFEGSGRP